MIGGVGAAQIDVDIFFKWKSCTNCVKEGKGNVCNSLRKKGRFFLGFLLLLFWNDHNMMAPRKRPHFCFFVKWRVLVGRHVWPMYWNVGIVTKIYNQLHNTPTTITIFLSPHFHHTHPPPSNVLRSTCGHLSRPLIAINVINHHHHHKKDYGNLRLVECCWHRV